jgi:tRNA pseudouridine32 synthase / 23S rRNA pseudouridine746 synthase
LNNPHQNRISYFSDTELHGTTLPERFTFPFYYKPHPLAKAAAVQLKHYLNTHTGLGHNFGLDSDDRDTAIGKMFGVLVVQDAEGRVGYVSAFSGKLAGTNDHPQFVPPVFDMLVEDSFFLAGQNIISSINTQIELMEADEAYLHQKAELNKLSALAHQEVSDFKKQLKENKQKRKQLRDTQKAILNLTDYAAFEADLIKQSLHDKHQLHVLNQNWEYLINQVQSELALFENKIEALKNERKEKSAALQTQIFEQYTFLNQYGETKSLQDIFSATVFEKPPAGAGECATPKLLQYAFANNLKPLAMAEFWWGAAPKSEIRQHGQYYPACTGKCKPILAHMLHGMPVDDNPLLQNAAQLTQLDVVYEDDYLAVVNKPPGLRSVPGIDIHDSVMTRLKAKWITIEPLVIHRLDMDTSGLLVVAKTPFAHKHIQKQFLNRTVKKRYVALLSKALLQQEGEIRLPLLTDVLNRPRQMVCFENGKPSITRWKAVDNHENTTRVHFWPLTGRTHQLRMHAAHERGLDAPIVGDDLYGTSADRLHLHAAYLEFVHPATGRKVSFNVEEDF